MKNQPQARVIDSTEHKLIALHAAHLGSIPAILYCPLSLPGVISGVDPGVSS